MEKQNFRRLRRYGGFPAGRLRQHGIPLCGHAGREPPALQPEGRAGCGDAFSRPAPAPFFKRPRKRMQCNNTALCELMALEFAINELGLYLDTHRNDKEALQLYTNYVTLAKEGRQRGRAASGGQEVGALRGKSDCDPHKQSRRWQPFGCQRLFTQRGILEATLRLPNRAHSPATKRISMVATSARVALPAGSSRPFFPPMIPAPQAHCMASRA